MSTGAALPGRAGGGRLRTSPPAGVVPRAVERGRRREGVGRGDGAALCRRCVGTRCVGAGAGGGHQAAIGRRRRSRSASSAVGPAAAGQRRPAAAAPRASAAGSASASISPDRRCSAGRCRSRPSAASTRARGCCPTAPASRCRRSSAARRSRSVARIRSIGTGEMVAGRGDRAHRTRHARSCRAAGRPGRRRRRNRWLRSTSSGASTRGRARWLSHAARPWPGMCFSTGSTPPVQQAPVPERGRRRSRCRGRCRSSGCAGRVSVGPRDVGSGHAVASMPDRAQLLGDQPIAQVHGARGAFPARGSASGPAAGAQFRASAAGPCAATRPPSWSIRMGASWPAADAQVGGQACGSAAPALDVAGEQDEAPRAHLGKEALGRIRKAGPAQPKVTAP